MKTLWTKYLNEVVGLTVMALMVIALIAGQAHGTATNGMQDEPLPILEIRVTISD